MFREVERFVAKEVISGTSSFDFHARMRDMQDH